MRLFIVVVLLLLSSAAAAHDYDREKRWSDQILPALMVGEAIWLQQKEGHKFLTLYTEAKNARGAVILAHGRGWSPDYELYGMLRTKIAELGYTSLAIQLPVLGGGAKIGDYIPTYPDAAERFQLAADFLDYWKVFLADEQDFGFGVVDDVQYFRRREAPVHRHDHRVGLGDAEQQLEEEIARLVEMGDPGLRLHTLGDQGVGDLAGGAVERAVAGGPALVDDGRRG